jgi:pantetheine-phosphate adenylyltransferase
MKAQGAQVIVRGLRAMSDFEYEFQMALTNQRLDPSCETVYLMPSSTYTYLNSTIVREIASFGESVAAMVPSSVEAALHKKLGKKS